VVLIAKKAINDLLIYCFSWFSWWRSSFKSRRVSKKSDSTSISYRFNRVSAIEATPFNVGSVVNSVALEFKGIAEKIIELKNG
jgi:hypothetical protein